MIQGTNTIPFDLETEEAILGGCLLDPNAANRILGLVHPEDFYLSAHQHIFRAILALHGVAAPTDLMSVTSYLSDNRLLEKVGGTMKLAQILDRTVSAVNIDLYAKRIAEQSIRRALSYKANEINRLAYDKTLPLEEVLNQAQDMIFSPALQKAEPNTEHNAVVSLRLRDSLTQPYTIYSTGLESLDDFIDGWEPQTLNIIGGRTGMGKTYFSLWCCLQQAIIYKHPVLIFSLEMSKIQLEYRLWSMISTYPEFGFMPISARRIKLYRAGRVELTKAELDNLEAVAAKAIELNIFINDDSMLTSTSLVSESRRLAADQGKLGMIMVDYIQLVKTEITGNRYLEVGDVAAKLAMCSKVLDCPVLALSQLNRESEAKQDKRPTMGMLSQSDILAHHSHKIILLYRDEYYNEDTLDQNILEIIVDKNRDGRCGTVKALFNPSQGMLEDMAIPAGY